MFIAHVIRTIGLAWRNFFANRKRNFFSVLTVVLGSSAIGAVFTVNENVEVYVDSLIARSGGPNLYIGLRGRGVGFDDSDLKELAALPSARYVVVNSQFDSNVVVGATSVKVKAVSVGTDYKLARPIEVVDGQFINEWDLKGPSRNAVLSPTAVAKLGIANPIGQNVTISASERNLLAHVVGIALPLYEMEDPGFIWMPESFFQEVGGFSEKPAVIVGGSSYHALENFEVAILEKLRPKFKSTVDMYNPKRYFEELRREYQTFINAGLAIGVLALIGGSIGVMNLMLVGIQLRTREIGLYRALGFPTGIVMLAFLFESLMILSFGGLVGSISGCISGYLISGQLVKTEPFLSQNAFVLGLSSSFIIGFVFAYIPARKAAGMDTVEALRS